MGKVIEIVLDGLRYDVMRSSMGYLNHLVEKSQAAFYRVKSELPSLSRPLYEVLLTGVPPYESGITANQVVRLSHNQSLFHIAASRGLKTAAAAYHWVSELYQQAPFNPFTDRIQHDETKPIQHGMFYFEDHYPDTHLFADAEYLRRSYDPDFLYIHPMNIDDTGHTFTSDSAKYRGAAIKVDSILAMLLPAWIQLGYTLLITSDHGMNEDGHHGGTADGVRDVPLLAIGPAFQPGDYTEAALPQLALAPLVCRLLGVPASPAMVHIPVPGFQAVPV